MFCGLGGESQFRTTIIMLLPRLYILWHRKEKLRVCSADEGRNSAVWRSHFFSSPCVTWWNYCPFIYVDLASSKIAITSAKIVGLKNSWTRLQHLSSDL